MTRKQIDRLIGQTILVQDTFGHWGLMTIIGNDGRFYFLYKSCEGRIGKIARDEIVEYHLI